VGKKCHVNPGKPWSNPLTASRVLLVKPPDRFLDNEFVYQQLGPQYLQAYLEKYNIKADLMVLYERAEVRLGRADGSVNELSLDHLNMLHMRCDGTDDVPFDLAAFSQYDVIGQSVMSPQAPDAYLLNKTIKKAFPRATTVIGGSHARYYLDAVRNLPTEKSFDFIVPQEGWRPMLQIASGEVKKALTTTVLEDRLKSLDDIPAPTRPLPLMEKYDFRIAAVPSYHTITALGCPFSCHFCESGKEKLIKFPNEEIDRDLATMAEVHSQLHHEEKAVMFFDDVGLMNPRQVRNLAGLVARHGYSTWRAFTHAYLVVKYNENLLKPFLETGGSRIGMGLETGSQRSLNLINKRNGQFQDVTEHYEAVTIANSLGIAVDAFTMIYPWEDEDDLKETTRLVEFVAGNAVNGIDYLGRPLKNNVDSTIMTPYQGTVFNDMLNLGQLPGVEMNNSLDPGELFYKGEEGGSGWPYLRTRLSRQRYIEEQKYRHTFRPGYR
jgi:radical SAM superfamily enzyme YgiQ (UPF0313 family)